MFWNSPKIRSIDAEEILDSRGNPTLRVTVATDYLRASAAVPSGASTGKYEAVELRDGDANRFAGKGVLKACDTVRGPLFFGVEGMDVRDQYAIDMKMIELDGTPHKSRFGANAMVGVSLAVARLAANYRRVPLYTHLRSLAAIGASRSFPYLYANVINGGLHTHTSLPFQEYMVVPETEDVHEAVQIIFAVQNALKKELQLGVGDEGGYAPDVSDPMIPLRMLVEAAMKVGVKDRVKFAMDVAASSFYQHSKYRVGTQSLSRDELLKLYERMAHEYPLISIEDPFEEEDFEGFALAQTTLKPYIVGDDLTVTNVKRLQEAIDRKSIGAIIIKPNQIGTLTETLETMKLARDNDLKCIVSHRSGETNDDFIADLAYAFGVFGIKLGALQRGERIAKYNRLLTIAGGN